MGVDMLIRFASKKYIIVFFMLVITGLAQKAHAVPMSCSFVGGISNGAISFGAIDPTAAGTVYGTVTTQVQFTCTKNNPITVTTAPASGWQLSSGPGTIAYTLGVNNIASGPTAPTDVFIPSGAGASNITQAQYINAPAGAYSNSSAINVTISWTAPVGSITATLPIGSVGGTVTNACSVTGSPALDFGAGLDASIIGPYPATVTLPVIKCTMSDSVTITEDYGVNRLGMQHRLRSGANYVNYNFGFSTPLSGLGGATDIGGSLAMNASIPVGGLDNAPAGTYTDTITLTLTY